MSLRSSLPLAAVVAAAALIGAVRTQRPISTVSAAERLPASPLQGADSDQLRDPPPGRPLTHGQGVPDLPLDSDSDDELPPDHPPIADTNLLERSAAEDEEPGALEWTAPPAWRQIANPSSMRVATYRIPAGPGAAQEAELSIVRAGGSTEENLARWAGQFQGGDTPKRQQRNVHGLTVATMAVSGIYQSGMGAPGANAAQPGWSLLGAVVETGQGSYFFKLTGPTASVRAARASFEAFLDTLEPVASRAPL
jgi:hypothetical protein